MERGIQSKKLRLIEWLLHLEDEQLIDQLDKVREGTDFWDELNEAEKAEVEEGIRQLDQGEGRPLKELLAKHRSG